MLTVNNDETQRLSEVGAYYALDYNNIYKPSILSCPFITRKRMEGMNVSQTVIKQETFFAYNYLEDGKAQMQYLAPDTILKDAYKQVTFKVRKIPILIESVSLECFIPRAECFVNGSLAKNMLVEQANLFRHDVSNLFLKLLDNAAFRGREYSNINIIDKGYRSFFSESTDPVDVGLPSIATGGSLQELVDLISKASDFLATSGNKATMEQNICIIVGRGVARQFFGVISGADSTYGMTYIEQIVPKLFGYKCFVSDALKNDMIIFDRTQVEAFFGDNLKLEGANGKYSSEPVSIKASTGLCSVVVYNKEKSLYYADVMQEAPALDAKQATRSEAAKKAKAKKVAKAKVDLMEQAKKSLKGTKWYKNAVDRSKVIEQEVPSIVSQGADSAVAIDDKANNS